MELTANFEQTANQPTQSYTITFNASGGAVNPVSGMTSANGTLSSLPTPARSGYTFNGWYMAATGGTQVTTSTVFNENATIYAQWTQNSGGGTTFVDSRDGKTYKKVTIGTQTWMAENLNYDVPNNTSDVCYENSAVYCTQYGRLYSWATAMNIDAIYNNSYWNGSDVKHRGVCPSGWHLPSDVEWNRLGIYVDGGSAETTGTKLKSKTGWNNDGNGTDAFGFSALPGGDRRSDGSFGGIGTGGWWWSATEYEADLARHRSMMSNYEFLGGVSLLKVVLVSVRCVQD